jgi:3-hydroxy-9,10-secoandrosta-1,3,5(10)-triene-9,17-dione monooxygenase reductase component
MTASNPIRPGAEADDVDPATFRQVLGHFCTGVTIVTSCDETGEPAGLACQSFTSLSLDPPLVVVLDDVLAWVHCDIEAVHDGGDHQIVVGAVRQLHILRDHGPLLYFRGAYGVPALDARHGQ